MFVGTVLSTFCGSSTSPAYKYYQSLKKLYKTFDMRFEPRGGERALPEGRP